MNYTSSYLKSLIKFIINPENKNSKSIIFVNHRMICQEINKKLNLIFDDLYEKKEINEKIISKYVIGISTESKNNLLNFTKKDLDNNIKNFRNNDNCKVLIATNVVEEGIDIPDCNNVICLSTIKTIKEYIQKSGRARQKNSKIILFSTKKNEQINKDKIQEIKIAIKVMKNLINDNSIIPKVKKYNYINNYNIIESNKGVKIYLDYSKVVVEEFVSKLFNDGYTWNRVELKDMELKIDNKIKYFPYLSLPSVLECSFKKIYEVPQNYFDTKNKSSDYGKKYIDFFYFKAVKLLHKNGYLNEYFQFNKNYDNLLSLENKFIKTESEKHIQIKIPKNNNATIKNDYVELLAHLIDLTPKYFDLTYSEKKERFLSLLSENPITVINFDLFIPSSHLIKLYYFNTHYFKNDNEEEESKIWYGKKTKIPYTVYSKLNISIDKVFKIKIPKNKMHLINFFYVYSLFVSTDAEMFFYYCIYYKKFDFCQNLFKDEKLFEELKTFFEKYDNEYLSIKQHLKNYSTSELNYQNHLVKISLLLYNKDTNSYEIDFPYIEKFYNCVIEDIFSYSKFLKRSLKTEEEIKKLLNQEDESYLKTETMKLNNIILDEEDENEDNKRKFM